jgi:hypothetical protein
MPGAALAFGAQRQVVGYKRQVAPDIPRFQETQLHNCVMVTRCNRLS